VIEVRLGTSAHPDVVVTGKPEPMLQLLSGRMNFAAASESGVTVQGSLQKVLRVIPQSPTNR
jgi:hypothetical protein